jgi:hypothetical protein
MNRATLDNHRGYWCRQLSDCSEPDFSAVLDTLEQYGGTSPALWQKTADGVTLQGSIDPKTPLTTISEVYTLATLCASRSIPFIPVVVPRGDAGEAEIHAIIAGITGCLVVDIESGAGFYDGAPPSTIPAYFALLREAAPDAFLVAQPDPRNLDSVLLTQWLDAIDGIAAQHYVGWKDLGWTDVPGEVASFDSIRALGKPVYPTIYGTGSMGMVATFWRAVRDYAAGLCVFRFGALGPAEYAWLQQLRLPGEAVS